MQYKEIQAAKAWGIFPWDFEALPPERKAILLAYESVSSEIENYFTKESMKDTKEKPHANWAD